MNTKGYTVVELLMVGFLLAIIPVLIWFISLWTDRNLEYWIEYFKGVPVDVPMWMSVVITVVFNGVIVALNIVSELLKLAI